MSSAAFIDFSANSATEGGAVTCSWIFDPAYVNEGNAKHIYIYQTDTSLNDATVVLGQTYVVPLIDPDTGLLTTSFIVTGLTNNWTYLFSCEVTVKPTLAPTASNTTSVYNSATILQVIPTTYPAQPNFFLTQEQDYSFSVQLSTTAPPTYTEPTPISVFDGYSELTGVYVIYSNGTTIRTDYFANDGSLNVYVDKLVVDVSDGYYEVAVSTENIAANGVFRRSNLSNTQIIFVNEEPGPPLNVSAVQQIVVDASGIPPHMLITWNPPTYLGNPELDSYYIYRRTDPSGSYAQIATVDVSINEYIDDSDTTVLVPGTNYTYQIYAHNSDGLSDTPGTSNSVLAWTYPNQVLNLELVNDVTSSTTLIAEWDISTNVTGLPDEDLIYELVLTDASGVDVSNVFVYDLSYSFTDLNVGEVYTVTVYAGVTFNTIDYFNPVNPATATNTARGIPLPVTNLVLSNVSSTELNATWSDPSGLPIDGLTIASYDIYILDTTTDPSGTPIAVATVYYSDIIPTYSYLLTDLIENHIYEVSVYANYTVNGSIPVETVQSSADTATGAPHGAPTATVLSVTSTNTLGPDGEQQGQTVLLSWTLDSAYPDYTTETAIFRQITDTSNGAIVQDFTQIGSTGNYDASFTDLGQGDASSVYFVNGNLMTYYVVVTYTDTGFTPSSTAEVTSNEATAIPYSQPPQPLGTGPDDTPTVDPGNSILQLFWTAVSDSYNLDTTGLEFQFYKLYLDGVYTGNTTNSLNFEFRDLSNNVEYQVGVSAVYNVGAGGYFTGIVTESIVSEVSGMPYANPLPELSVTADNNLGIDGSQKGKTVLLNWNVEAITGFTSYTDIYRQISAPNGTILTDPSFQFIAQVPAGGNSYTDDASSNIGNPDFLNGNTMTYYVDIQYSGTESFNVISFDASAIPYSRPTPCDASGIEVDLSLCIVPTSLSIDGTFTTFTTTINKNGTNITTFVAVGLAPTGNAPVIVFDTSQLEAITYSNAQLDGICAADQVAQITLTFENPSLQPVSVSDVLDVISNAGGSLVAAYPSDGAFNI